MKRHLILIAAIVSIAISSAQAGPLKGGYLKTKGTQMVDESGQEVILRGFGLGNWYLPEGYMWKFGPQGDRPRKIEAVIEKVLGKAEAAQFWKDFRDAYITESDIRRIAQLGFNSVRPALKARDFLTEGATPTVVAEGYQRLDQLIQWCKKYDLYVILDLHAAPGGQTGKNIDDSARDYPDLFTSDAFQAQTEQIWVTLAQRYKDEPTVAAYDLLNEPLPSEFSKLNSRLEPLYKRLTFAIRKVDKKHMIILEGANWANDWSVFGTPFDKNVTYQFHKYWNDPDRDSVRSYIDFQKRHKVPVWIGEYGESKVGSHWYWASTQLFEDMRWGWAFWPWKKLQTESSPYSIKPPKGWEKIQAVSNGQAAPPRAEGRAIMAEFLRNVRLENCVEVPEVISMIMRRLPARIEAENFGHLGEGKSYRASSSMRRAETYRRGEPIRISSLGGLGYNLGWIEQGEWISYDLNVDADGAYDFSFRVAAESGGKSFRLEQDGRSLTGEIAVPSTGGWDKWAVVQKKGVRLKRGPLKLRFVATTGGHNLDWFSATPAGSPPGTDLSSASPRHLPGLVQAEDYAPGGEGVAYHDNEAANQGGAFKTQEGVDIQALQSDAGLFVTLDKGEWLAYEVNSVSAQTLTVSLQGRSKEGGSLQVQLNGKPLPAATIKGGWSVSSMGRVSVPAGKHVLTLAATAGQTDIDWIQLKP